VVIKDDELIVAGAGELHVEVALNDLKEFLDFNEDLTFRVGEPNVEYCESVSNLSSVVCMAKSPNHHNRLQATAEPLSNELCLAIENNELPMDDPKELAKILSNKFEWDQNDCKKIWFWSGSNCVVDQTTSIAYLNEIKDSVKAAFEWVVSEGGLCGEPLRGVKFNLIHAELHTDTVHRGQNQILVPARSVFLAAQLSACPCIYEPIFLVDIQTEIEVVSKIYGLLFSKRGYVFEEIPKEGSPLVYVKAYLPVIESFGFVAELCEVTSGRAFPQMLFSHYEMVQGDPHSNEVNLTSKIVRSVRSRKKMKEVIPTYEDYNDKL